MPATLDDLADILNTLQADASGAVNVMLGIQTELEAVNQNLLTVAGLLDEISQGAGAPGPSGPGDEGGTTSLRDEFNDLMGGFDRSLQLLYRTSFLVNESIDVLVGSMQKLAQSVELYDPGKVFLFDLAVRDLTATIGSVLSPIIDRATQLMRVLGGVIDGAGPHVKAFGAAMVAAGAAMTAATVAAVVLSAAINSATFGLSAILGAITGLAAGTATFVTFADTTGRVIEELGSVLAEFGEVFDVLGGAALSISKALAPLMVSFAEFAVEVAHLVAIWAELTTQNVLFIIGIELMAAAMNNAGRVIRLFTDILAEFGLIRPYGELGDSTGRATAQASFMGAQQYAERAYTSAFSLGEMSEKEEEKKDRKTLIDYVATIADIAQKWWNKLPDAPVVPGVTLGSGPQAPRLDLLDIALTAIGPIGAAANIARRRLF